LNKGLHNYLLDEYAKISDASRDIIRNQFDEIKLDEYFVKTIRQYDH
jgi:hypothetical protein